MKAKCKRCLMILDLCGCDEVVGGRAGRSGAIEATATKGQATGPMATKARLPPRCPTLAVGFRAQEAAAGKEATRPRPPRSMHPGFRPEAAGVGASCLPPARSAEVSLGHPTRHTHSLGVGFQAQEAAAGKEATRPRPPLSMHPGFRPEAASEEVQPVQPPNTIRSGPLSYSAGFQPPRKRSVKRNAPPPPARANPLPPPGLVKQPPANTETARAARRGSVEINHMAALAVLVGVDPVAARSNAIEIDGMAVTIEACVQKAFRQQTKEVVVKWQDANGFTLLHHACSCPSNPSLEVIKLLVDADADVNSANATSWTAMHYCASNGTDGHIAAAKYLLGLCHQDVHPSAKTSGDETALAIARRKGHRGMVSLLEEHTVTSLSAPHGGHVEIATYLGQAGNEADLKRAVAQRGEDEVTNWADGYSLTLLHTACDDRPSPRAVRLLLKAGANPNRTSVDKTTPLLLCAWFGTAKHLEIVKCLLDCGADRRLKNIGGETPLDVARRHGRAKMARLLDTYDGPVPAARKGMLEQVCRLLPCAAFLPTCVSARDRHMSRVVTGFHRALVSPLA